MEFRHYSYFRFKKNTVFIVYLIHAAPSETQLLTLTHSICGISQNFSSVCLYSMYIRTTYIRSGECSTAYNYIRWNYPSFKTLQQLLNEFSDTATIGKIIEIWGGGFYPPYPPPSRATLDTRMTCLQTSLKILSINTTLQIIYS